MEAVSREARSVVVQAEMKRRSFRGVIDVIYGGEKPERPVQTEKLGKGKQANAKRKAAVMEDGMTEESAPPRPISKREQKRQAKKARFGITKGQEEKVEETSKSAHKPKDPIPPKPLSDGEAG